MTTSLEATFMYYWRIFAQDMSVPTAQYKFHPKRRWKLDYAFVKKKVGIELQGAGGVGYGRRIYCHRCGAIVHARKKDGSPGKELRVPYPSHGKGAMLAKDAEKNMHAILLGWHIVYITPRMLIERNSEQTIGMVVKILEQGDTDEPRRT